MSMIRSHPITVLWVLLAREWPRLGAFRHRTDKVRRYAIARLLATPGEGAQKALFSFACGTHSDWHVVVRGLAKSCHPPEFQFSVLARMAAMEGRPYHRAAAVSELRHIQRPEVLEVLRTCLSDKEGKVSMTAANVLLDVNPRIGVPWLCEWADSGKYPHYQDSWNDFRPFYKKFSALLIKYVHQKWVDGDFIRGFFQRGSSPLGEEGLLALLEAEIGWPATHAEIDSTLAALLKTSFVLNSWSHLAKLRKIDSAEAAYARQRLLSMWYQRRARERKIQFWDPLLEEHFLLSPEEAVKSVREVFQDPESRESDKLQSAAWLARHGHSEGSSYLLGLLPGYLARFQELNRSHEGGVPHWEANRAVWGDWEAAIRGLSVVGESRAVFCAAAWLAESPRSKYYGVPKNGCIELLLKCDDARTIDLVTLKAIAALHDDSVTVKTGTEPYLEYVPGVGDVSKQMDTHKTTIISREEIRQFARRHIKGRQQSE